jgi:hypothetical protein
LFSEDASKSEALYLPSLSKSSGNAGYVTPRHPELALTQLRPAALAVYMARSAAPIKASAVVRSPGNVATPNEAVTAIVKVP